MKPTDYAAAIIFKRIVDECYEIAGQHFYQKDVRVLFARTILEIGFNLRDFARVFGEANYAVLYRADKRFDSDSECRKLVEPYLESAVARAKEIANQAIGEGVDSDFESEHWDKVIGR